MKLFNTCGLKLGTAIALFTTMLVGFATIGIAIYSLYYIERIFNHILSSADLYSTLSVLKDCLLRMVFACLVLALIISYYITKLLINPLDKLITGAKELSEGNLSHRLKLTKHPEINELINTYNIMAENLQALYRELDNKVKERTIELEAANNELKNSQVIMVHSEKMRSLGQLVAGITHEINNPINFIHGNLIHLKKYAEALLEIIDSYEKFSTELNQESIIELTKVKQSLEYDFIKEDLPLLLNSCHEGTIRTKNIILDLKNFSRIDELVVNKVDLEKEIETTLNILKSKIKNKVEIIKEYDTNLPKIEGYGGQLNQVFMNILDNACYAITTSGKIFIRLIKNEKYVILEVEDTGCGMDKEQVAKIFEPFYTTKPVGEGTGLGMSISYKVIQAHAGTIVVESTKGAGTCFKIKLPIVMQNGKVNVG